MEKMQFFLYTQYEQFVCGEPCHQTPFALDTHDIYKFYKQFITIVRLAIIEPGNFMK